MNDAWWLAAVRRVVGLSWLSWFVMFVMGIAREQGDEEGEDGGEGEKEEEALWLSVTEAKEAAVFVGDKSVSRSLHLSISARPGTAVMPDALGADQRFQSSSTRPARTHHGLICDRSGVSVPYGSHGPWEVRGAYPGGGDLLRPIRSSEGGRRLETALVELGMRPSDRCTVDDPPEVCRPLIGAGRSVSSRHLVGVRSPALKTGVRGVRWGPAHTHRCHEAGEAHWVLVYST